MKKLLLYPFTYEHREIFRYKKYIADYQYITGVTANEPDFYFLNNYIKEFSDVSIENKFENALDNCDTVLFCTTDTLKLEKEVYLENIRKATEKKREVFLTKKCRELLGDDCPKNVTILEKMSQINRLNCNEKEYLKNISVPAIGIMGMGQFCNKFCTELEIHEFFKGKGYKAQYFGSKDFAPLFGGMLLPDFLFDTKKSVTKRILLWNQYLFELCKAEQPDILIIGIPGGIMPLNNKILNGFGECASIITNGIHFDIGILCSYFYERVDGRYFEEYKNYCKYRLNCDVGYINISNSACRYNLDSQESVLEYLHYESEMADKIVVDCQSAEAIGTYNILNGQSKEILLNRILTDLTEGVSAF